MAPTPLEEGATAVAPAAAPVPQPVGIIYPPPEVRNIVDKTATFVARNGTEFEQRIKQNEVNNPKFNFLNPGDPYHAYYQHKVMAIRDGRDEGGKSAAEPAAVAKKAASTGSSQAVKQRQSELIKQAQKEIEPPPPTEPPPEFEFMADPPSISAFDLDVVKLTAQFVARNGRKFLTDLMQREQKNFRFDFLRPTHSLFQYFTKLLEQYTKVLIPPKDLMKRLTDESDTETVIMEQIDYRLRWIRAQEARKRREEEEAERERVSYAQIDWHNFVVVETVDYQQWEVGNFPPPTNPGEVGARVLMQRRVEQMPPAVRKVNAAEDEGFSGESNMNVEDMEEGSSSEEESDEEEGEGKKTDSGHPPALGKPLMVVDAAPAVNQPLAPPPPPPPSLPTPGNVEVRKYDPKQAKQQQKKAGAEEYLVSPITGERVPASKVQEHMRIGLLDPRWVEERDKQITARASEDAVFAPGQSIETSLKHLAERRTDIFGVGEEAAQEAAIGQKIGEERSSLAGADSAWDGHSSSAEAVTRAAREKITLSDQIEQIHRQKGLLADKEKIGPKTTTTSGSTIAVPPQPPQVTPQTPQVVSTLTATPQMPPQSAPIRPVAPAAPSAMQVSMIPAPQSAPPVPVMVQPPQAPPAQFFVAAGPPGFPHMPNQMIPGAGGAPVMDLGGEEPPNKRARGEDHLIPEGEFASANPSPVQFTVVCPVVASGGGGEWRLNGQAVGLTLPLTDTVSVIKARLHEETGMPPGKQKLQLDSIFLKDANSLAYYNVRPGTVISLLVKERGGRKK